MPKPLCPLLYISSTPYVECKEEKCAWWVDDAKCCVLEYIATTLRGINWVLARE